MRVAMAEETRDGTLSRAEFLKAGVAAAAAITTSTVGAEATAGGRKMGSKKIRIGVVGGGFGSDFFWHQDPNCIVQAVSDLIPERRALLQRVYACSTAYESLEKLILDKDVDAVAVFTGAPDHVRHAVACLHAGKHVISAVPACMSLAEAELLHATVKMTGLTYMMAETSWYHQSVITARQWYRDGKFGKIFHTEAEYHHPGLEVLFHDAQGKRTWRYGLAPMNYPTHCTAFLHGVTGEHLTHVSSIGYRGEEQHWKDNVYNNPFSNETAFFTTDQGHSFRVGVYWAAAVGGTERGQWFGDKMSFFDGTPNGLGPVVRRAGTQIEKDDAGFARMLAEFEQYNQPKWWQTEMLPEPMRHDSGHDGSHTFLTHEFIDALSNGRHPAVGINEALNLTVPGIVAHESSLAGGVQKRIPVFR